MDLKLDDALKLAKKTLKEGSAEEAKRIYQDIWSCHGLVPASFEQCLL